MNGMLNIIINKNCQIQWQSKKAQQCKRWLQKTKQTTEAKP
jgi:hypothetical protein